MFCAILFLFIQVLFIQAAHANTSQNADVVDSQCSAKNIQIQQKNEPNSLITIDKKNAIVKNKKNSKATKQYTYKIINRIHHDKHAFTQGLVLHENMLYESSGLFGESSIRKINIDTGDIILKHNLPRYLFGEGISVNNNKLVQLTWKTGHVLSYTLDNLKPLESGRFSGEGWGVTSLNNQLIYSDGTSALKWLSPALENVKALQVSENGVAVQGLNELEFVKGYIYANIWPTDCISKIDPQTGDVIAWVDLTGLYPKKNRPHWSAILNGIAYHEKKDSFFVTGKYWPYIFEIQLREKTKKINALMSNANIDTNINVQ